MARRLDAILAVDVTTMAAQVRVPVLYLQARGDRLVGADALADARAVFPTFQEARLDGPHLLLQRYPARAADCIDAFCATVESQNSGMT
jgi:pimeloyl-ACP methyl ester carboxylesterase